MVGRRELQGWDQIADYLGLKRRTVQNYEKSHSFPVHRMPGRKGRVFAYTDEIDAWKEKDLSAEPAKEGESEPPSPEPPVPEQDV